MKENILFSSLSNLPGVGEKTKDKLTTLLTRIVERSEIKIIDILHNIPRYYIDRSEISLVAYAPINKICTFKLQVLKISSPSNKYSRKNLPINILCKDNTETITLQFFGNNNRWITQQFTDGEEIIVSGKTSLYKNQLTITHPDYILSIKQQHLMPKIEPIYSLISGISNKMYQKYVSEALSLVPQFNEWIDAEFMRKMNFPNYKQALAQIHQPTILDIERSLQRLAYDELLAHQLGLKFIKQNKIKKIPHTILNNTIAKKLENLLPFKLTTEQKKAFIEITQRLEATQPMSCLLQGDVGCGKTIVAALAMVQMADAGYQCALMAPTEVLARQHYSKLTPLFTALNIKTDILTRCEKASQKTKIIDNIQNGKTQILIGTHALLSSNVIFKNLGLTVIDEQHRFGVEQRATLLNKSKIPHLLIMTATPIPRTLILTEFGETSIIQIKQKPKERKPIKTKALSNTKIDSLIERIKIVVEQGAKIYWICPLIEESQTIELMDTVNRYDILYKIFKNKVGLIHGKQTSTEKEKIIEDFTNGTIQILVSTTVIEVGIDIPDATIMIIEHAERFGLSQLHQLRGRVGRSDKSSSCVLLYQEPLSIIAQKRLDIMLHSEDGFYIAEQDLLLRGEGEIFGTRQSGAINFIFADLAKHVPLLEQARIRSKYFNKDDLTLLKIYSTVTDFAKLRG